MIFPCLWCVDQSGHICSGISCLALCNSTVAWDSLLNSYLIFLSLIVGLTFDTAEPQLFLGVLSYYSLLTLQIWNLKAAWVNISHSLWLNDNHIASTSPSNVDLMCPNRCIEGREITKFTGTCIYTISHV